MERLTVLTLNLWGEQPPLARRMEILEEGIHALSPDVVALQEVRQIPGRLANQAETLASRLGWHCAFAIATSWGEGDEGLAILSRLPMIRHEARELPHATPSERRIVLGAALASDQGELAVFTTHLNYRLGDGLKRERQVLEADAFVTAWPSTLPKILMGDFNATPDHDEIRFLRGWHSLDGRRTVYQDAWARLHPDEPGHTWSGRNPYAHKLGWLELDRRLDYVFVTPLSRDGRGRILESRIVFDQPASDSCYASDHFGLSAIIQIAPLAI